MSRLALTLRLLLAILCLAVPAWVALTRWSAVVHSHPAYQVLLLLLAAVGVALTLRIPTPEPGTGRKVTHLLGSFVLLLLVATAGWLRPYAAAPPAVEAASPNTAVDIREYATMWELRPTHAPLPVGLVFFPGALVDPQAYLALLRPLAEQGHQVVVVKPPLGVALLSPFVAGQAFDDHPEVLTWAVGGHSLGGTAAAQAAGGGDPRVSGLLLWASYPAGDISGAPVEVLSITGENDGLTTPEDVGRTRALLPGTTEFVQVPGAVHAFFGDYGDQAGDGRATTSREGAQQAIVDRTRVFLDDLATPARTP